MSLELIINNEQISVHYERFENILVHPHCKKIPFANKPNLFGQNNFLYSMFRTELKTDDFLKININCVLLVNRFAVGLLLH